MIISIFTRARDLMVCDPCSQMMFFHKNNLCIEPILLYVLQHLEIAIGLENNIDKCQAFS